MTRWLETITRVRGILVCVAGRNTVGDRNTVWDLDTAWDLHTAWDRHTAWDLHTAWDRHTAWGIHSTRQGKGKTRQGWRAKCATAERSRLSERTDSARQTGPEPAQPG
jgi:hypothetical protein